MSFLILAFRKLSLKRQINHGNFKLMNISMNQQRIQNQLASLEEAKSTIQDAWTTVTSSNSSLTNSIFQAQIAASQKNADDAKNKYNEVVNTGNASEIAKAKAEMEATAKAAEEANNNIFKQQYTQAMTQTGMQQAATSLFEAANKAQITALNKQDKQYDMQKESLNTQMEAWNAEYSGLEKSVQTAAKNAAPSYVA